MTWNWEEMTSPQFAEATRKTGGVCIIPIGCIEKHGEHLPLGTDCFAASRIAQLTADVEPAIVFPFYPWGAIHEAKHTPGTIALKTSLLTAILENLCDEIGRNGMKKIILLNGHGGNESWLASFVRSMTLEERHDYTLHLVRLGDFLPTREPEWLKVRETEFGGHADEHETSVLLATHPEYVDMDAIPDDGSAGMPQKRLGDLPSHDNGLNWYADYPEHYAGDARSATAEKGKLSLELTVRKMAAIVKGIREDTISAELRDEFFSRIRH